MAGTLISCRGEPPPQRYSYYSPGDSTVNLQNTLLQPELFVARGRALPGEVIVLTGLSRRLMRLRPDGSVVWMLNVQRGGGAYGLAPYKGRVIVAYNQEVLVIDAKKGRIERRIPLLSDADEPLNFLRVQDDLLIAGTSSENSTIVVARLRVDDRRGVSAEVLHRIPTRSQHPRDALFLGEGELAIADTFGHAVVLMERRSGWREVRRLGEYFPNMLELADDGELMVLSEHANRITRWNLRTGSRATVVSCPDPLFRDPYTSRQHVVSEESRTKTAEVPPRQSCSVDFSGSRTLYAANGFALDGPERLWVADADNHRVVLFVGGEFWGDLANINHPIRIIPVSNL